VGFPCDILGSVLTIRAEQMETLRTAPERQFVGDIETYLHDAAPETCKSMGREAIREAAELALAKGREYGIGGQFDVLRYVNFMFILGFDFDTSLDWARQILLDRRFAPETRLEMIDEELDRQESEAEEDREPEEAEGA
jgi:hypothetical protein